MKKYLNRVAGTLLVLSLPLVAPADDHASCKMADELATAGELTSARTIYTSLLKETPDLECARNSLDTTRVRQLRAEAEWRRGSDWLLSGRHEEARAAYLKALESDPSRDDIRKELGALFGDAEEAEQKDDGEAQSSDPYEVAIGLLDAGYETQAKEKARKVWDESTSKPIPKELQVSMFDRLATLLSKNGGALVALFFLGWIAVRLARKLWSQRPWAVPRPCQVIIEKIDDPSSDLEIGRNLRERLVDELSHASSPATHVTRVSQPGATPIPQLEKLPPQISFLEPLLKWVQTQSRYNVLGIVHSPVNDVAAFSVRIHDDRGGLKAHRSFSEKIKGDKKAAYLELATSAGAWAVFEIQRLRYPRSRAQEVRILGSTRWQSYGLFRRGEHAAPADRIVGHDSPEVDFFHQALAEDHNNTGALIKVGHVQCRSIPGDNEENKMIEYLERARKVLGDHALAPTTGLFRAMAETRVDPLWFQATYELAVAHVHRFALQEKLSDPPKEIPNDLRQGIKIATQLAKAIGATQLTLGNPWRRRSIPVSARESLQLILHQDARYLVGVLAGAKASAERFENSKLQEKGENTPPTLKQDDGRWKWFRSDDHRLWKWLSDLDHTKLPSAHDLVEVLERDKDTAGGSTLYNLACFYARARDADKALKYLKAYFEHLTGRRRDIETDWASRDPSLRPAKAEEKTEFDKLLVPRATPPATPAPPTPMAPEVEWVVEHFATS